MAELEDRRDAMPDMRGGGHDGSSRDQRIRPDRAELSTCGPGQGRRRRGRRRQRSHRRRDQRPASSIRLDPRADSPGDVQAEDGQLLVDGRKIQVLSRRDPADLPWGELGATVVVESTGQVHRAEAGAAAHLEGGAKRVVISAPAKEADATFVMGVNDGDYDPALHVIVSNASCTTNCFVPMVKVLDDAFGIEAGLMTTVHAMTNDQNLLDLAAPGPAAGESRSAQHRSGVDRCRACDGAGASDDGGTLDGMSLRVPVGDGSITDFTALVVGSRGSRGRERGVQNGLGIGSACRRTSSTPTTRSCRRTSSATRRRASSTPVLTIAVPASATPLW